MVILQSCLDVLRSDQESFSPSSGDGNQFVFVSYDDDLVIKKEEDLEPTTSTAIKDDPLVSCMFCVYRVLAAWYRY
jgi:hypothetical protein